jgi:hypothetical protein
MLQCREAYAASAQKERRLRAVPDHNDPKLAKKQKTVRFRAPSFKNQTLREARAISV